MQCSRLILVLVVASFAASAAGCVGNEPQVATNTDGGGAGAEASDASARDAAAVDASGTNDAGAACDLSKPFEPPQPIAGIPGGGTTLRLSPDELTAYYNQDHPQQSPFLDLYVAFRQSPAGAFAGNVSLGSGVNSSSLDDFHLTVTGDGLQMIFGRSGSNYDLYLATRTSKAAEFPSASPLLGSVNTALAEVDPYLTPDGRSLYFVRGAGTGTNDLFRASLMSGTYGGVAAIAELNTGLDEHDPVVTPDELTIYWASSRTDVSPQGGLDIYMASRLQRGDPFGQIRNVTELNSSDGDFPSWVSSDGCRLYFGRGATNYMATHPR